MLDFRVGQILALLARTLPFIALRLLVYLGITVVYVVVTGVGSGFGLLFGKVGGNGAVGAFWGALVGFGIVSGVLYWAREYVLYLVKAGHIAVLVELMEGRAIPADKGQIEYARRVVKEHFATSSTLFGLNQLIRGILRVFNRLTVSIASWLPIPGLDALVKLVDVVVNTSLSHLDQVVLAQILRQPSTNPWATARDSVVLYAQNYRAVLKNAAFLTFIIWGLTALLFVLVLGPAVAVLKLFPHVAGIWSLAFAVIAALSLKAALIDPFATVALMQIYDKITHGQSPNPEWSGKLESMSGKFRELAQKARDAAAWPESKAPAATQAVSSHS
jgi:hypothetical protein